MYKLQPYLITQDNFSSTEFRGAENYIVYSQLNSFEESSIQHKSIAIKYVISGQEKYIINGKKLTLQSHQFLLLNTKSQIKYRIQSQETVRSITLFLSTDLMVDVYKNLTNSFENLLNIPFNEKTNSFSFFERVYDAYKSNLGLYILQLSSLIEKQPNHTFSENIYFQLAENIFTNQNQEFKKVNAIAAKKASTRAELYRRLLIAKNYIEANFDKKTEIETIAKIANISTFHFFRTFKQVFGLSPHQYILNLRLTKAKQLLKKKENSITNIAYQVGFADIHAFSKAFKKNYAVSPSHFR